MQAADLALGVIETKQPKKSVATANAKLKEYGPKLADMVKAEREAKVRAELEAKKAAEAEARRKEEEKAKAAARIKALEEAKKRALEEAKRRAAGEATGEPREGETAEQAKRRQQQESLAKEEQEWAEEVDKPVSPMVPLALTASWATLAATAAASLGAALYFDSDADAEIDKATACVNDLRAGVRECTRATYDSHVTNANSSDSSAKTAGIVAGVALGAAAATAAVRYLVFGGPTKAEKTGASMSLQPAPGGVVFGGRF